MNSLNKRYVTEELTLELADHPFRVLRVTNTDELYAELLAKGETHEDVADERIPYWADLWPSALALATEVLDSPYVKSGTRVLEIGCGLALPGIAAGMKGAKVLMTDYLSEPLDFACINWKMNLPTAPQTRLMDWRFPDPHDAVEVILASDVAYEKRSFEFLLHAFRTLLVPGGHVIMSEPNRMMARDFFKNLPSEGFSFERKEVRVPLNGRNNTVSVYLIHDKSVGRFGK
jgi:predicted nicotinamide N-methyase